MGRDFHEHHSGLLVDFEKWYMVKEWTSDRLVYGKGVALVRLVVWEKRKRKRAVSILLYPTKHECTVRVQRPTVASTEAVEFQKFSIIRVQFCSFACMRMDCNSLV